MTKGRLVLAVVAKLEDAGLTPVYLRNHEGLPEEVGNDVDLLIAESRRPLAEAIAIHVASANGWVWIARAQFSPVALYFACPETAETLHIDLFDRIDWHWVEYADSERIRALRIRDGSVHVPCKADAIFLNIIGRLIYHGVIRDKHRIAAMEADQTGQSEEIDAAFLQHLGPRGKSIASSLRASGWSGNPHSVRGIRRAVMHRHGICQPLHLAQGVLRFLSRAHGKLTAPPAPWVLFLSKDEPLHQEQIDDLTVWLVESSGGREPWHFRMTNPNQWKALRFWIFWMLQILPRRAMGHVVIGIDSDEITEKYAGAQFRNQSLRFIPSPSAIVDLNQQFPTIEPNGDARNAADGQVQIKRQLIQHFADRMPTPPKRE